MSRIIGDHYYFQSFLRPPAPYFDPLIIQEVGRGTFSEGGPGGGAFQIYGLVKTPFLMWIFDNSIPNMSLSSNVTVYKRKLDQE